MEGARAWGQRKQGGLEYQGLLWGVRVWGEGEAWVGAGLPQGPGTPWSGRGQVGGGPERATEKDKILILAQDP